jgi:hypothetical protein
MKRIIPILIAILMCGYSALAQTPTTPISTDSLTLTPVGGAIPQVTKVTLSPSTQGTSTWYYWFIVHLGGVTGAPSGPFSVTNAPTPASSINYINVTWNAVRTGATYDILRTSTSSAFTSCSACVLVQNWAGVNSINDNSTLVTGYTIATSASQIPVTLTNLTSSSSGGSGSWATTIDASLPPYSVSGGGKACFDGTVTNASPNISSAGQCTWTSADIGSLIFVTNPCNSVQCGYTFLPTSVTILPSTQVTTARIATISDSYHIIVDCNAPATCSSPNASATDTSTAVIVYGKDQTAGINAAFAAAVNTQGCPAILYPQGIILFRAQIWGVLPNSATNACSGNGIHNLSQVATVNGGGPVIEGLGALATIFTPLPDLNFSSCALNSTFCIGGASQNMTYKSFSIMGFGQSMHFSGLQNALFSCASCSMRDMILNGWMNNVANSAGISTGSGFATIENVQAIGWGGTAGGILVSGDENVIANSSFGLAAGPAIVISEGGNVQTTNVWVYNQNPTNATQIDASCGYWQSTNDRFFGANAVGTSPSDDIKIENGCTATLVNFNDPGGGANDNGIEVVAGGILKLSGYNSTGTAKNKGLTVAGTFFDLCGNTPNYGSATNSITGSYFGSCSTTGTAQTAANITPTSGFGTGCATAGQCISAVSGGTAGEQFTVTYGTTPSSPQVLTIVFPVAFPTGTTPLCRMTDIGGTNAVPTSIVTTTCTPTGASFTITNTPVGGSTDILQITAGIP